VVKGAGPPEPPPPPPAETNKDPIEESTPLLPLTAVVAAPEPPLPIVIVYDVPGITANPEPVLNPPPPPPPPAEHPPPAPPATARYSTDVTPSGHTHVDVALNICTTVEKPLSVESVQIPEPNGIGALALII
jgi:hypothetical protein